MTTASETASETARYCATVALANSGQHENPRPLEWVEITRSETIGTAATSLAVGGRNNPRGCFRVTGGLPHGSTIQPRNRAAALLMLEVIGEWLEDNPGGLPVLSVDAWRNGCGGWDHNATYPTGEVFPRVFLERKTLDPRGILAWFREHGLLDPVKSPGRVAVVDDGADGLEIVARGTGKPLYWVPWHDTDGEGLA